MLLDVASMCVCVGGGGFGGNGGRAQQNGCLGCTMVRPVWRQLGSVWEVRPSLSRLQALLVCDIQDVRPAIDNISSACGLLHSCACYATSSLVFACVVVSLCVQVSEQVDSLRVLFTDPVDYLVTPRVLASMIAGPILNVLCFCMGELQQALAVGLWRGGAHRWRLLVAGHGWPAVQVYSIACALHVTN
jgi:hypothetical protein